LEPSPNSCFALAAARFILAGSWEPFKPLMGVKAYKLCKSWYGMCTQGQQATERTAAISVLRLR
jgi:hypothetical protein